MIIPKSNSKNKPKKTKLKENKKSKKHISNKKKRKKNNETKKLEKINHRVSSFFNKANLTDIAKKTGYLIRKSPITPFIFLYALSLGLFGVEISLDQLALNINSIFDTNLTGCAFSTRMRGKKSVLFLKSCFEKFLALQLELAFDNKFAEAFSMFNGVILEDSTVIELNEKVSKGFKGCGGAGSKSSVKLNWIINICCFSALAVDLFSGSTPDRKNAKNSLKYIKKGMLLIRDMGYFLIEGLKAINKIGAYYLSRIPKGTFLYLNANDENPLDVVEFFKKVTRGGRFAKIPIFLGKVDRFETTLVLQKAPKWVLKQRLKQYKKKNSGKSPSDDFITWAKYSVFITNIPEELFSTDCKSMSYESIIMEIYKIRWQIELLFKKFKSKIKLSFIKGKSKNRVLCLIYGKLISILLTMMVLSYAASKSYDGREISLSKVTTWLVNSARLANAILNGTLYLLYSELGKQFKLLCKDKRNRQSALESLGEALPWMELAA